MSLWWILLTRICNLGYWFGLKAFLWPVGILIAGLHWVLLGIMQLERFMRSWNFSWLQLVPYAVEIVNGKHFFSFESKSLLIFLLKYSFWSLNKHRARLVNVAFTHNFWMCLWAFCHLCTLQIFRINYCASCTSSGTVVQAHSRNLSFHFIFYFLQLSKWREQGMSQKSISTISFAVTKINDVPTVIISGNCIC